jgi:hypothetical protein
MFNLDKQKNEGSSERIINGELSRLKFHILIILFIILAIVPILSISAIRRGNLPVPLIVFTIWMVAFYKISKSVHDKNIVSYWVSLPCAVLVIIASLFY